MSMQNSYAITSNRTYFFLPKDLPVITFQEEMFLNDMTLNSTEASSIASSLFSVHNNLAIPH
jgi:hypothetical protein